MAFDFDVVVVGGANYDYLARGEKLPDPGETAQGDFVHDAPGGKGANQAVGAARLGAKVAFIGRVGEDERGYRLLSAFDHARIDTSCVGRDPKAPTGVALIHVNEAGEKQILAVPGANTLLTPGLLHDAAPLIRSARVLLLQLEVPLETTLEAARMAHQAGIRVLLDPAPAIPLPDELPPLIDFIKPNAAEAKIITGIDVHDRASATRAALNLLARGVKAAAVTAGHEGTILLASSGEEHWLPRWPVKSIDATGAGDSFAAAMGVMLAEERPWAEAGAFANAAAALTTTIIGAQESLPTREAVQALLQRQRL